MPTRNLFPFLLIGIYGMLLSALTGCQSDDCIVGELGCECNQGVCFEDLSCEDNVCQSPCQENAFYQCVGDAIYWFDSCDEPGELLQTCDSGTQACTNVTRDTAECTPVNTEACGNDSALDPGEECDGTNLDGATCESRGYAGGQLACTDRCTFDESDCDTCGNGVVDGKEECDGNSLDGASCQSQGYDQGSLRCTPDCRFDVSECGNCACDTGVCCDGCDFLPASTVCETDADIEYFCPWGQDAGQDVGIRTRDQYCSGDVSSCNGSYGPWTSPTVVDNCSDDEVCQTGDPTCNPCQESFDVSQYECFLWSNANGSGNGGGEIMEICSTTDFQTGHMTVRVRKHDGSTFGSRPYQVRVSGVGDDPCGPLTHYYTIVDSNPTGIGTGTLVFSFPASWLASQVEKHYCVTASTQVGDPGYDPSEPQQQSWWYSDKTVVTRTCN